MNQSSGESAMQDEMNSLMSNQIWQLTELLCAKKALQNKWVYWIKEKHDGNKCYKERLVVKDFQQKGVDYTKIFSLVVNHNENDSWVSGRGKFASSTN